MNTKEFGFLAENIAARYLQSKGYEIIGKNYKKPWGEIDIIAKKDDTVFFVEVKANQKEFNDSGFNPEVRVDNKKIGKIIKTASLFMEYELKSVDQEWQVDIISVILRNDKVLIKHFKNIATDYL